MCFVLLLNMPKVSLVWSLYDMALCHAQLHPLHTAFGTYVQSAPPAHQWSWHNMLIAPGQGACGETCTGALHYACC